MIKDSILYKPGRHPSESYEDILDSDMVSSPDFLGKVITHLRHWSLTTLLDITTNRSFKKKWTMYGRAFGNGPRERKKYP